MPAIWRPNVSRVLPDEDVEVRGDGGRVEQGDEAEEGPLHEGAMRARGEVAVEVQGVQRLSARS